MITKTLNLDEAYQELFDEVRVKSNGAIDVDNLDAFYGSIEEIAAVDPKFLRLPLDEPLFEIDANTRKITVPAEFKSNGVSVQKDHLAEVIFFRIERYFDYTDLSTCNIVINWKMGSKEGKTTRFIKFEKVFTIDETKASCIVFGWPINDIVTEKSGQLSFAVEFFKTEGTGEDEKIIYRFNTLPTTVNIKDGLVIDDAAPVYELDSDIIRTLVNSSFGEGTAAVDDIRWLTGDGNGLVAGEGVGSDVILKDFASSINLNTTITGGVPSSDIISLYAEGYVDEGTRIRYTDANNEALTAEMLKVVRPRVEAEYDSESGLVYYASAVAEEPMSAEEIAAAVEAEESLWIAGPLDESLKYYKALDGGAFEEAEETDLEKWGTAEAVELFVKVAKIDVVGAGSYIIKAQGYKVDNDGNKIGNGDVKATATVTVPAVVAPSAIEIEVSELDSVEEGYSFADDIENVVFLPVNGEGTITANAVVDAFGALQFSWQKKVGDASEFSDVSEQDVAFQAENGNTLTVSEAGQYKVSVVNFLNGASAEPVESAIITASPLAGKIESVRILTKVASREYSVFTGATVKYNSSVLSMGTATLKVDASSIQLAEGGVLGTPEYQWYKEEVAEVEGNLVSSWVAIDGATDAELIITSGDGVFRPVIKNNYNGSIYTLELDSVSVDDLAT